MIYENARYGSVRPTGFSSWPTLDPLSHPTEQLLPDSQEDDHKIDLSNVSSSDLSGGFFIGYHAYPYYPDFIVQDPVYRVEADAQGPNSYLGYLKALKQHYKEIPLVIAEFGVPSSWGSGHLTPSGMNHGGISEEQQGHFSLRMLESIFEAGCAGGIQFSLIDEWFKQTWITNPYSDRQYRHFWHNLTAPEQNFGILSYAPPSESFQEAGSFPGEALSSIKLSSDYTFFRVRIHADTEQLDGDTLWVAFDTYEANLGESVLPNGLSLGKGGDTLRAEFVLQIPMDGNRADLFVIPSYDLFGIKDLVRVDTVVSTSSDQGIWNPVRWKTNYFYDFTQYIGQLNISESRDPYHFLNAVTLFKDSLEIRIPWTLLNYHAPTVRRAMHYLSYHDGSEVVVVQNDTLSEGIAVTVANRDDIYQSSRYSWSFWDYEKIVNKPPLERKKESFFTLKDGLPRFNSPPIGRPDSFEVFPGNRLQVDQEEGLLSNDFDFDGNAFEAALAFGNSPGNGDLQLHPDGSFTYLPGESFQGEEQFTYFLDDGYTYSGLIPVTIRVGYPLAIPDLQQTADPNRFRVFPNPGTDRFFVEARERFLLAYLEVYDMTGRLVMERPLEDRITPIEIVQVEPGIYIFSIKLDNQLEQHRVIIQ
jgi:hypothetical protein